MRHGRLALAAMAGLAISFLLFATLMIVTPDEDIQHRQGEVRWERFQFEQSEYRFTQGSLVVVKNADLVPLRLFVTDPEGGNVSHGLEVNETVEVRLDLQGTYRLQTDVYVWGYTELEVRSANPLVRFFEDLF